MKVLNGHKVTHSGFDLVLRQLEHDHCIGKRSEAFSGWSRTPNFHGKDDRFVTDEATRHPGSFELRP